MPRRAGATSAPSDSPHEEEITLSEHDGVRYLHFGTLWIQGAMSLSDPWRIELEYVQRMMAWLLFLDGRQRILQLGLGAGALARWCWRRLPQAQIAVVERSRNVIEAGRNAFALPPDDARLQVHCADAAAFVANTNQRWGVLQVDLYDRNARGPACDSAPFYRDCHRVLDEAGGMMVVNLFGGEHRSFARNMRRIEAAFDGRVMVMAPLPEGNTIVLAFRGPPLEVPIRLLQQRANAIERRLRLPANQWLTALFDGEGCRSSGSAGGEDEALIV